METKLLEAINEMQHENFKSLNEAGMVYSNSEILDSWLRYEGIIGYTEQIMLAVQTVREIV